MANTNIPNSPSKVGLSNIHSIMSRYGGLAKSCRYAVRILPQGSRVQAIGAVVPDLTYLCETAEFPGRGLMTVDTRTYGPNQKLPYQSSYEDLNLTFLCRNNSWERRFFDDWMNIINPVNSFNFSYLDEYKAEIQIYQFNDTHIASSATTPEAIYQFSLHSAYPLLVNPQAVSWADDQFLRLGISFAYSWWTRKGIDKEPSSPLESDVSYRLIPLRV